MTRTREAIEQDKIVEPEPPVIVMSAHGFLIRLDTVETWDAMDGMVFVHKGQHERSHNGSKRTDK